MMINQKLLSDLDTLRLDLKSFSSIAKSAATGYYFKKYYNTMDCTGSTTFIEGYSTGICLQTTTNNASKPRSIVLQGKSKDKLQL